MRRLIISSIIITVTFILLSPFLAYANRGMIIIGPKEVDLQESGQNAIVAWNGEEEVLILSTDVRSSESALVLEVLPLPSDPIRVEEGSFDSFRRLTGIINKKVRAIRKEGLTRKSAIPGVEITFHKKIGAHDITVVKVNDLDYFINWVKGFTINRGFKHTRISDEFKDTVANYLNRDIRYFVFDVITTSKDRQSIKPLVYRFKTDYLYYPLEITATSHAGGSTSNINIFIITKGMIDKDIVKDLNLQPKAGFDHEIALTKGELREVSPELEDLFRSDAFAMNASYHGPLNRLKRDLFYNDKIKRARELFRKGEETKDLSEKESFYIEALALWPEYAAAHNNLGDVYERQGRFDEAIKEYEIASMLAPDAPYPYFGLGDVYFKLGRYEQSAINYEKGLRLDPDDKESEENLRIAKTLIQKILFPFGSCRLTDTAIEQLKAIATSLSSPKLVNSVFELQGHTDNTGSEDYNLCLSEKRAERVKRYLVEECGIAQDRLTTKGYGEDRPIASNETKEGRMMNRRVEIRRVAIKQIQ